MKQVQTDVIMTHAGVEGVFRLSLAAPLAAAAPEAAGMEILPNSSDINKLIKFSLSLILFLLSRFLSDFLALLISCFVSLDFSCVVSPSLSVSLFVFCFFLLYTRPTVLDLPTLSDACCNYPAHLCRAVEGTDLIVRKDLVVWRGLSSADVGPARIQWYCTVQSEGVYTFE